VKPGSRGFWCHPKPKRAGTNGADGADGADGVARPDSSDELTGRLIAVVITFAEFLIKWRSLRCRTDQSWSWISPAPSSGPIRPLDVADEWALASRPDRLIVYRIGRA
jgi:hypothetical protein